MIKILIVEDDFRIANIHEEFINKIKDVKVVGKAMNGEETLTLIKKVKPDLLLLDIYLPDYNGTELIKAARNIDPTLDIIIITASKEKELLEKSLRHGVINYLIKPVSLERFIEVLKDYRKRKVILEEKEFVDQDTLDELFTQHAPKMQAMKELPKGIDRITLEKVQYFIEK